MNDMDLFCYLFYYFIIYLFILLLVYYFFLQLFKCPINRHLGKSRIIEAKMTCCLV